MRQVSFVIGLAVLVVAAGCLGTSGEVSRSPTASPSPTSADTATKTLTKTPTSTPVPIHSLPSPAECSIGALPKPTTELNASAYPVPPENVTRASLTNWMLAFAKAYERNRLISMKTNAGMNLTAAFIPAEIENTTRLQTGWAIRIQAKASTRYESGAHGDIPISPHVYFVNETIIKRIPLTNSSADFEVTEGKVLLDC